MQIIVTTSHRHFKSSLSKAKTMSIMDDILEGSLRRLKRNRTVFNLLNSLLEEEEEVEEQQEISCHRPRTLYPREAYRFSFWYTFMEKDLSDLNSRDGRNFRLRFTVPYQVYTQLLAYAEEWFPQKEDDICGRETTPIFLKLLGTLRMLGKGCSWDLLYELSGISGEIHRNWTHAFLAKFSKELYPIYVHGPRNAEELNKVTSLYAASGFPGCVGSTDCAHIRWDMCPASWFSAFRNGTHNYASIAYEMTVDHTKRFQSITIGHYGTTSGRPIVNFDGFVNEVQFKKLYTDAEFKLQVDENKWIIEKGLYLLVDSGYHKWRFMQVAFQHTVDEDAISWSELVDSVRKDVKCAFGKLKKRYQILKNALKWQNKSDIDNAVLSCVILHNMLLHEFDGYDERWEAEILNTHYDEEEQMYLSMINRRINLENTLDNSAVGRLTANSKDCFSCLDKRTALKIRKEYGLLRVKLVEHLKLQHLKDK